MNRESRYLVFKIKDLNAYLSDDEKEQLDDIARKINRCRLIDDKELVQCVVVEHDWPEHESTWKAIERRVDGVQPCVKHVVIVADECAICGKQGV